MPEPRAIFAYHRGVAPGFWVLAALGLGELVAVHLLLVGVWPRAAFPISAATLALMALLVGFAASLRRCPHRLWATHLELRKGARSRVMVPLAAIAHCHGGVTGDLLRRPDTRNLVPLAFPNRVIELAVPLSARRPVQRIAIRLDDPAAFDAALVRAGIAIL